uniref:Medium-chain acyl-CoA ligase ACSF2, mitochondrial n=1 Tax=Caenorhabditis tropicalis TaxID=1561998 RepID=A0A1I7T5K0_9PELO
MTDFNIDQYEITVTLDDNTNKDDDKGTIKPKLYPDLSDLNEKEEDDKTIESTEYTVVLKTNSSSTSESETLTESTNETPNLRKWLLNNLSYHRKNNPAKIALIEEVSEVRCVTYEELVDGSKRTANYMSHHGVNMGDKIMMCMENTVEYVFYQLGAFLLGAIPVLINPSHIASGKLKDIGCSTVIVDFEHYGHVLRISQNTLRSIQRVFVLAEDIAAISLARHVWIIDGFGYLSFSPIHKMDDDSNNSTCFILPGSLETDQYISHSHQSGFQLCHDYFNKLFKMLSNAESIGSQNHLITDGLHCQDALSYLFIILTRGETCVLAESTLDVWRASLLDRIAGIIEQYKVSSEMMESILSQHKLIHDVAVMQSDQHVWCGVLLKNENETPTSDSLEKLLKKHHIPIAINKVIVLDFIPRTEKGKIIRNEMPFIMNFEKEFSEQEEISESYI